MKLKCVSALALAASLVAISGCADDGESRFDPRGLGNNERGASHNYTAEPLRPLPTTLRSQYMPGQQNDPNTPKEEPVHKNLVPPGDVVRLSLREIEQRAVANNLNVQVSGYNPGIDETSVTEAEARFDPEAFGGVTYTHARGPLGQFAADNSDQLQFQAGLRQQLPSGGQVELAYTPTHVVFANGNSGTFTSHDFWTSQVQLQLTQPLLQNFGNAVNHARIVINRLKQRVTLLDFRHDVEDLVKNVEQTYWQLVQARQNQMILERLLQRTLDTADIVSKRFGQDVTLEQISNSVSRVETARADLIRARQRVKDLSDQLKGYMNDAEYPIGSQLLILPSDQPVEVPISFDMTDTVNTALANRYDLGQQQLRVDSAGVALEVAKNNKLPQLNLVGNIGNTAGGIYTNSTGVELDQGFGNGFNDLFTSNRFSYSVGLQFTQKLGNREANAIYRRAQLQRQQAITQYQQLIEQATLEVKVAQREVETRWQLIAQTRSARFAAAKALEVIETLARGGEPLRPDFVERELQRQQDLANAEQAEAEAVAGYNIGIADLEQKKGTILRYNNILLDEKAFDHDRP
ncbi:MAG: TolC family protein [Tepidisphaeraceae bacterium]